MLTRDRKLPQSPREFATHHPGGMVENSPTFQRWELRGQRVQVPKGRLKLCARSAVPSGLIPTGPFDLVYERYSLWSFAGMEYARAAKTKGLLEVNAPLIEEQAEHRGLVDRSGAERVAAQVLESASALLAVSEEVARYLSSFP